METTELKTNLGETIKVSPNFIYRYFIIKTEVAKFRTTPMTKE